MAFPLKRQGKMRKIPKLTSELIDKEKWRHILQRLIDVLQINIFIVDSDGRAYLTPSMGRYGWKLLSHSTVGVDMFNEHSSSLLDKFKKQGFYLEYHYPFMLHSFAVPMDIGEGKPVAYMVVGPIVLNKRLDNFEYEEIAKKLNLNFRDFMDSINEIKVVSFINLKSILDLLYEVSKYVIQLNSQRQKLHKMRFNKEILSKEIMEAAQDIYSSVYLDELLTTLLDVALNMTKTECGSIMVVDNEAGDLIIKVSRGIDKKIVQNTRVKIGEGIAGLAAKENSAFVIRGAECDNRIKPFLKRPEINQALVTPLILQNRVFGVMNLHTKSKKTTIIDQSLDVVQQLSKLTSVAINSIQQKTPPA